MASNRVSVCDPTLIDPTWIRPRKVDGSYSSQNTPTLTTPNILVSIVDYDFGTAALNQLFPSELGTPDSVTVLHNGTIQQINTYTGNVYFAVVPVNQVQNKSNDLWPSPVYLSAGGEGLVGWLNDTTYDGARTDLQTFSDIPVSLIQPNGEMITGRFVVLAQVVDNSGNAQDIKLLKSDDGAYQVYSATSAYMSGLTPFLSANDDQPEAFATAIASTLTGADVSTLNSRIRTKPLNVDSIDRSGAYPIFYIFPASDYDGTMMQYQLYGWYFNSETYSSTPSTVVSASEVSQRIQAALTLQKLDGASWSTAATKTINTTNPAAAAAQTFNGLIPNTEYRIMVVPETSLIDGDGRETYVYQGIDNNGAGYGDVSFATALENLYSGASAVPYVTLIDDPGTVPLDTPVFKLLERLTADDINYAISINTDNTDRFNLDFTINSTTNITELVVSSGSSTHTEDNSGGASSIVVAFTNLTESELERNWTITGTYVNNAISFAYAIGSDAIGSLQVNASGVFSSISDTEPTTLVADPSTNVYTTRTIETSGPFAASRVVYESATDHDIDFNIADNKHISAVGISVEGFNPFVVPSISYYLVVDGIEHEISPLNLDGVAPSLYYYNSILSEVDRTRASGQGFVDTDETQHCTVRVRITRPAADINITPVVTGIRARIIYADQEVL